MNTYITNGLDKYIKENHEPWHMPGHKRALDIAISSYTDNNIVEQAIAYASKIDVTEVPGTDDLHMPTEMIKASMDELTQVYGTYASYYLVNGSTCGIFTAIASIADNSDKKDIFIAYNCHKSVYNAVYLLKLNPIIIEPKGEYITVEDIQRVVADNKDKNPVGCVLTSPSYEGVCIDIKAIKDVLSLNDIKLIVDEAHGAHFNFMKEMPQSAVELGADIAIQSLHKTLASLTQTAILHNQCEDLDESIRKYLSIFMTSSPSYVLLSSMELAIAGCVDRDFSEYMESLNTFRTNVTKLQHIELLTKENVIADGAFDYDVSRLVISVCTDDGKKLFGDYIGKLLDKEGIVIEMSGLDYVVLISTYMDSREAFDKLYNAFCYIDKYVAGRSEADLLETWYADNRGLTNTLEKIDKLYNVTSDTNLFVYPPGIPIVRIGETIEEAQIKRLKEYAWAGKEIRGLNQ